MPALQVLLGCAAALAVQTLAHEPARGGLEFDVKKSEVKGKDLARGLSPDRGAAIDPAPTAGALSARKEGVSASSVMSQVRPRWLFFRQRE
jgi:hypothetical protein